MASLSFRKKIPSERSLGDAVLNLDYESKSPGQVATNVSSICALFLLESYAYGQTPIRRKINELVVEQFNLAFCCIIKVSFSLARLTLLPYAHCYLALKCTYST